MTIDRVLFAAPHRGVPGPIRAHTELLCDEFTREGVESAVLGWGRHRDGESVLAKVLGRIADMRAIVGHLAARAPQTLVVRTAHDWSTLLRDLPLVLLATRQADHVVIQFHGSQIVRARVGTLFGSITGLLVSHADGVLLLSQEEQEAWTSRFPHVKVAVVCNAFQEWPQAREYSARSLEGELGVGVDLVYVGRLIREKGAMEVIDAVALLPSTLNARLTIVGSGPDEARLRERVRELHLEREVEFAGRLEREELARVYGRSHCLVLPTYWAEGFPTVLCEAMSFGLPIITTANRGAADHLVPDVNALFVPPRDAAALAAAITRIAAHPGEAAKMGVANRESVGRFAPPIVARSYLAAVSGLCGEKLSTSDRPSRDGEE